MGDLSKSTGSIGVKVFLDMYKRLKAYKEKNGVMPKLIYLKSGGSDYISYARFKDMLERYRAYKKAKGVEPAIIYINKTQTRTVGPIQKQLEAFLGEFDSFTSFYNKCKGRGYSYYYNDIKTLDQEIAALKAKTGLNCSDASQLAAALANEMGYSWRYIHVQCQSGGHIRGQIKGNEFSSWTDIDMAACISEGSQYSIGNVWCDYDNAHIETENWILIDDGA